MANTRKQQTGKPEVHHTRLTRVMAPMDGRDLAPMRGTSGAAKGQYLEEHEGKRHRDHCYFSQVSMILLRTSCWSADSPPSSGGTMPEEVGMVPGEVGLSQVSMSLLRASCWSAVSFHSSGGMVPEEVGRTTHRK